MRDPQAGFGRHRGSHTRRWRRDAVRRLVSTVLFTLVELWAVIVLLQKFRGDVMAHAGLALVLTGATVAVFDAWRELRVHGRTTMREGIGDDADESGPS